MPATKTRKPLDVLNTDATAKQLFDAVQANPRETDPELQLVDRLQECGVSATTAKRFARDHRYAWLPMMEWDEASRRKALKGTSVEAIQTALKTANGRRRERTLELNDVLRAVKRARRDGFASDGGGTVANSYKYPAEQTGCVVAVATNGNLRVAIGVLSARKGASVTNQLAGITARGTADDYRAWADAAQPTA